MEILTIVSYRRLGKAKISPSLFWDRCARFKKKNKLKLGGRIKQGSIAFLQNPTRGNFLCLHNEKWTSLSVQTEDQTLRVVQDSSTDVEISSKDRLQTFVPVKLLQGLGVPQDVTDSLKKLQTRITEKHISPSGLIVYKDMILLSHSSQPRMFIGGEEINPSALARFSSQVQISLFDIHLSSVDPGYAMSILYKTYKHRQPNGWQVLNLDKLRRLVQHNFEQIVKKAMTLSDPTSKLWDGLCGGSDLGNLPADLNPVVHQKDSYCMTQSDYLPKINRLLTFNNGNVSIDRQKPKSNRHGGIGGIRSYKQDYKIETGVYIPRTWKVVDQRYLFMATGKTYAEKFALTCVDLQKRTLEDRYLLEWPGNEITSQASAFCHFSKTNDLIVLKKGLRQNYFNVLVAGFKTGLLLFTYYEKKFGLSGVFEIPDGKNSSIPVTLCPSSCGRFSYAYTSSEIYRVVIKPDKLL